MPRSARLALATLQVKRISLANRLLLQSSHIFYWGRLQLRKSPLLCVSSSRSSPSSQLTSLVDSNDPRPASFEHAHNHCTSDLHPLLSRPHLIRLLEGALSSSAQTTEIFKPARPQQRRRMAAGATCGRLDDSSAYRASASEDQGGRGRERSCAESR